MSPILNQAITIVLATSRLPPLQDIPPITITDLLYIIGLLHIIMTNLPEVVGYGHGKIFTPILSLLDVLSLLPFL